jgi:hypothetical protein
MVQPQRRQAPWCHDQVSRIPSLPLRRQHTLDRADRRSCCRSLAPSRDCTLYIHSTLFLASPIIFSLLGILAAFWWAPARGCMLRSACVVLAAPSPDACGAFSRPLDLELLQARHQALLLYALLAALPLESQTRLRPRPHPGPLVVLAAATTERQHPESKAESEERCSCEARACVSPRAARIRRESHACDARAFADRALRPQRWAWPSLRLHERGMRGASLAARRAAMLHLRCPVHVPGAASASAMCVASCSSTVGIGCALPAASRPRAAAASGGGPSGEARRPQHAARSAKERKEASRAPASARSGARACRTSSVRCPSPLSHGPPSSSLSARLCASRMCSPLLLLQLRELQMQAASAPLPSARGHSRTAAPRTQRRIRSGSRAFCAP